MVVVVDVVVDVVVVVDAVAAVGDDVPLPVEVKT